MNSGSTVPAAGRRIRHNRLRNSREKFLELFRLNFRIISGTDTRAGNPFRGPGSDLVIVSLDTPVGERTFDALRETDLPPYDLVVFDEAHKLSAAVESHRIRKTQRYGLAEALAGCADPSGRFAGLGWAAAGTARRSNAPSNTSSCCTAPPELRRVRSRSRAARSA